MMGSKDGPLPTRPRHVVTVDEPFYLGKFEVTQLQWRAVMGRWEFGWPADSHPAVGVSWDECQLFVDALNKRIGGPQFFLPSEAQWEYACRAGSTTKWSFGSDARELAPHAWYRANSWANAELDDTATRALLHRVGLTRPNSWGLYDMHGNAGEWCADAWFPNYAGAPADAKPREFGGATSHVVRGGSISSESDDTRSDARARFDSSIKPGAIGVRIARRLELRFK
jgi:formylglycine-generating enzyme required for sulfatase activity